MWSLVRDEWWEAWWPSGWSPETICGVTVDKMGVRLVFPSVTQIFHCLRRPPLWDRTLGRRDPIPKSLTEGMTERSRVAVGTDSSWSRVSVRRVASTACPVHVYQWVRTGEACRKHSVPGARVPVSQDKWGVSQAQRARCTCTRESGQVRRAVSTACPVHVYPWVRTGEACRKHSVPSARVPVSQDRWAIAVECCGCTCGELCSGKHGGHWPTMLSDLWGKEST